VIAALNWSVPWLPAIAVASALVFGGIQVEHHGVAVRR
jgi:hypothetical protein